MHLFIRFFLTLFLIYGLTLASCTTDDKRKVVNEIASTKADTAKNSIIPKVAPIYTDTLIIDSKAAVFYQPDSLQIEKRKKEIGVENFMAGAGDYIYYINTSSEYLEKNGLPILDATGKKFLKFVSANKMIKLIKLDTLSELWGIYLFDPTQKPYRPDMTIIEEEYKNYYK